MLPEEYLAMCEQATTVDLLSERVDQNILALFDTATEKQQTQEGIITLSRVLTSNHFSDSISYHHPDAVRFPGFGKIPTFAYSF